MTPHEARAMIEGGEDIESTGDTSRHQCLVASTPDERGACNPDQAEDDIG